MEPEPQQEARSCARASSPQPGGSRISRLSPLTRVYLQAPRQHTELVKRPSHTPERSPPFLRFLVPSRHPRLYSSGPAGTPPPPSEKSLSQSLRLLQTVY